MKKLTICLLGLAFVGMTITSCQKEEKRVSKNTFTATLEGADAKTTLDGRDVKWEASDQIEVSDGTATHTTYAAQSGGSQTTTFACAEGEDIDASDYYAVYPASIFAAYNQVTLPETQDGGMHMPMYAHSTSRTLQFSNLCSVVKLHLQKAGTSVASITVNTDKKTTGTFSVEGSDGAYYVSNADGNPYDHSILISPASPVDISGTDGADIYFYLPVGAYSRMDIVISTTDGRLCTKRLTQAITFERNKLYTLTFAGDDFNAVAIRDVPTGGKSGLFSVSATQRVYFSQGNLQYVSGQWKFAEHQYDCLGTYSSSSCDLFFWSISGNNYGSGSVGNPSDYEGTLKDWGSNSISNGGNTAGMWRTLTRTEWNYLFRNRTNASNLWGRACIRFTNSNGYRRYYNGVVLLPDNGIPTDINFTPASNNWSSNTYTFDQWSELEAAGAIFLPAAGYRGSTSTHNNSTNQPGSGGGVAGSTETYAYYWTSTEYNSSNSYYCKIEKDGLAVASGGRNTGRAVRLVYNANTNN